MEEEIRKKTNCISEVFFYGRFFFFIFALFLMKVERFSFFSDFFRTDLKGRRNEEWCDRKLKGK